MQSDLLVFVVQTLKIIHPEHSGRKRYLVTSRVKVCTVLRIIKILTLIQSLIR